MWLIRNFGKKVRSTLHISWICFLFCCTFLLMLAAVAQFRHECFHAGFSLGGGGQKRFGTLFFKTEHNLIQISSSASYNANLDSGIFSQKQLQQLPEKSVAKEENLDNQQVVKLRKQVIEYFSSRRNLTKEACLTMFREEDESQNQIFFDDDPPQEQSKKKKGISDATKESSFRVESESSKFFMRATNPTRWIFYKHKSSQLELQWCPLYKSGSSSWMALFAKLSGALSEITEGKIRKGSITFMHLATNFRMFHSAASSTNNLAREDKIQAYTMVIVRHPFKRLLSAYRDKLERIKGREYYHKSIGKTIIQRFRSGAGKNDLQVVNIFGRSFTVRRGKIISAEDYNKGNNLNKRAVAVINQNRIKSKTKSNLNLTDGGDDKSNNNNSNQYNAQVPTFEEFCKYLISVNPATMNEHWRPQFLDCSPCHHKFDLILKVEDIEEDKIQVFKLLGLNNMSLTEYQEIENVWERWSNRNRNNDESVVFNESYYFSQLSDFLMRQLYELYEPDFKLFGYSPDEYFSMTKNSI